MQENKNELVSIIIRCFNEEKHIGNLINSIKSQTYNNYEIVIVDSGSTDNTLDIVKKFPVKIIKIKPEEFTFGLSLNRGCEAAKGKYLVLASAHILPVNKKWLEELIVPFSNPQVDIVYGRQIGNYVTKFSEHQVFAQQFPTISNFEQATPFCNNANCAVRRSTWEEYLYDATLTGLEDLDLGKKVIKNGKLIAYNAEAAIYHMHEETPREIFNRYKREAIALKRIFPDSHLYFLECIYLWVSNLILDVLRAIKNHKFMQNFTDIIMFRTMQYFGTYSGIHIRSDLTREMLMRFYYPRKPQNKLFTKRGNE